MDRFLRVTHPSATKAETFVRLACVKHAASVRSEPGSNSQVHHTSPKASTINKDPVMQSIPPKGETIRNVCLNKTHMQDIPTNVMTSS